ncbi:MAG: branched-chain amino acid ABC transporter permease [Nitrososphaerales archaeon]
MSKGTIKVLIPFFILAFIPPLINNSFITTLFISSLLFGTLGAAFDFSMGYAGLMNFGFAAYFGIGAYATGLATNYGLSPWIGILIAIFSGAFIGFIIGLLTGRLVGIYFAMVTWFFAETLRFTTANLEEITKGYRGLLVEHLPNIKLGNLIVDFTDVSAFSLYYFILALSSISIIVMYLLVRSRWGLIFRAIKDDEIATSVLGINIAKYKILNSMISGSIGSLMGWFYAHWIGIIDPDIFSTFQTVYIVSLAYIGGRGTLWGAIFSSFILTFIFQYLRPLLIIRMIIMGGLLALILIVFPKGLSGIWIFLKKGLK